MTDMPPWQFQEMTQTGIDFESEARVAAYDRDQGVDQAADRDLVARLGIGAGQRMVEFGCGTGSLAVEAARRCMWVDAVDVSETMLDSTRERARTAGVENMAFHHAGFLTYDHQVETADFVVTRYALHHLPDFWKMTALTRLAGMLKPGGRFYLADVVFSFESNNYRQEIDAWIERVARPEGEGFSAEDFRTHLREEYSTYGWILEGMIRRAGLTLDEAVYYDPVYAAYTASKPAGYTAGITPPRPA